MGTKLFWFYHQNECTELGCLYICIFDVDIALGIQKLGIYLDDKIPLVSKKMSILKVVNLIQYSYRKSINYRILLMKIDYENSNSIHKYKSFL